MCRRGSKQSDNYVIRVKMNLRKTEYCDTIHAIHAGLQESCNNNARNVDLSVTDEQNIKYPKEYTKNTENGGELQ